MNLFAVALLVVVLDGCRRYRSLEEIEESLEQLEQVPVTPTADDPLLAGFERVRRMFAPGGEPIFADHQLALEAREYQDRAVELVAEAAAEGDEPAQRIIVTAGRYCGIALSMIVQVLNPQRIVVGGGLTRIGPALMDPAMESMRQHTQPQMWDSVQVVPWQLEDDVGIV